MRPHVRAFRNIASQVCQQRKHSFVDFMQNRGLEDILTDAETQGWDAKRLALEVLLGCCTTDGKFNNFVVGFLTVMQYLNEQFGSLRQGEQVAFSDLATILKTQGTEPSIQGWLDTHYP